MNMLIRTKPTADDLFNHRTVFQDCAPALADLPITTIRNLTSSIFRFEQFQWITVADPAQVVFLAPASCMSPIQTIGDRAFSLLHKSPCYQQEVPFA